ncbi:hypothetical protein B9Z55_009145 [Caenorhabditis nigoni]|uniref:Uncharacterized protein n=1 Tax=Caenorhabditis nigoni TaxID=1611254 RepID=A0A2G5UQP9_9PELO|nr:hypothetical protein B9Z55_009145 [Caenorhabditis nigoni]
MSFRNFVIKKNSDGDRNYQCLLGNATKDDVRAVLNAIEQLSNKWDKITETRAIQADGRNRFRMSHMSREPRFIQLLSTIRRRPTFVSTVRSPICRSECKGAHLKKWKIGWLHRAERTSWSHLAQIPTGQGELPKFHPESQ